MANKAIFFDRDGTLIEDPGYLNNPDQVKLLDGVCEALIELKSMGYKLVVASNQSGVARGIVTEETLEEIHNRLKQLLAEKGAYLDKIYYCPYHPEGVIPKYRKEWYWRKPNPGMLLAAADELDVDLEQSWMLGNSGRDIEAGQRAGCRTILIIQHHKPAEASGAKPDYEAVNIREAVNIIKKHIRTSQQQASAVQTGPKSENKQPPPVQPEPEIEPQAEADISEKVREEIPEKEVSSAEQHTGGDKTEQLLGGILEQLKSMHREGMFDEFSGMRMTAGIMQGIVPFCVLISIWLLMGPTRRDSAVLITLGFAILFQLMALTFYVMQRRK
jgi:D,D-heptose 1,7-bisphosphate phosphatase